MDKETNNINNTAEEMEENIYYWASSGHGIRRGRFFEKDEAIYFVNNNDLGYDKVVEVYERYRVVYSKDSQEQKDDISTEAEPKYIDAAKIKYPKVDGPDAENWPRMVSKNI